MKNISRLVGIAALAALPAFAQAQGTGTTRPVSFGVSAGASVPTGDLGDAVDVGYTIGANVLLAPASLRMIAFRGDVTFDSWKYKTTFLDGNFRALGVMGNVILKPGSAMAIKPYAIGGVGLLNTKGKTRVGNVTVDGESQSNFGAQVGGGLEFPLSGFTTFIEAKFTTAFSSDEDANGNKAKAHWIPITFGIRF